MGHSWREMDPEGAARHDQRIDRELDLRDDLGSISLGEFTVDELPALARLFGIAAFVDRKAPQEEDLKLLEKKVKAVKRRKRSSRSR